MEGILIYYKIYGYLLPCTISSFPGHNLNTMVKSSNNVFQTLLYCFRTAWKINDQSLFPDSGCGAAEHGAFCDRHAVGADGFRAVSYTHLTLPTILLV